MYLRILITTFAFNLFFFISDLRAADVTIEMLNKNKETKKSVMHTGKTLLLIKKLALKN